MRGLNNFIEMRFPVDISCGSIGGPSYFTNVVTMAAGHEQRNINWSVARRKYNVSYGIKDAKQFAELVAFFHNCRGRAIGFRFKDWSDFTVCEQIIAHGDGVSLQFQLHKIYESNLLSGQIINYSRKITKPVFGTVKLYVVEGDVDEDDTEDNAQSVNFIGKHENETICDDEMRSVRGLVSAMLSVKQVKQKLHKCKKREIKLDSGFDEGAEASVDYTTGIISFMRPVPVNQKIIGDFEFDVPARFDSDYLPASFESIGLNSVNNVQIVEIKV